MLGQLVGHRGERLAGQWGKGASGMEATHWRLKEEAAGHRSAIACLCYSQGDARGRLEREARPNGDSDGRQDATVTRTGGDSRPIVAEESGVVSCRGAPTKAA